MLPLVCVTADAAARRAVRDALELLGPTWGPEPICVSDVAAALAYLDRPGVAEGTAGQLVLGPDIVDAAAGLLAVRIRAPFLGRLLLASDLAPALGLVRDGLAEQFVDWPATPSELAGRLAAGAAYETRFTELRDGLCAAFKTRHLLLTGATGFLGQRLVAELLRCTDVRLTVLARERRGIPYDERMMFRVSDYPGRLDFVKGDVVRPELGLSKAEADVLHGEVEEIWHLAALTAFDEVLEPRLMAVNVEGTRNALSFAAQCTRLECFNHVSTAYIVGKDDYPDGVPETPLVRPMAFNNGYEASKYEAECLVVESPLPWLVFRPSIVLGDSLSGRADGKTVYDVAKMARLAWLRAGQVARRQGVEPPKRFRVVVNPSAHKNLLALDWVVETMLRARAGSGAMRQVYHITHPTPAAVGDLIHSIAGALGIQGYEPVDELDEDTLNTAENLLHRAAATLRSYMVRDDPVFDCANTLRAAGALGYPRVDRAYLDTCIRAFLMQRFGSCP